MAQLRWSYPVLMIPLLAGLASAETEDDSKSVCSGDSVQIFKSIQINNSDTSVTIYKNGDKTRPIAWWTSSNHTIIQKNLVMDEYKNIWIINVHPLDEGNYMMTYDLNTEHTSEIKVKLSVWVPPPASCKLDVTQQGIILTVSLLGKDCGIPRASAYWKYYSGVTIHDEFVLQLQSGKEVGTYYACMKGPALSCVNSSDPSSDHCFPYSIREGQSQSGTGGSKTQSGTDGSKDDLHAWLIAIVFLQCAGLVPVISFGIYRLLKKYECSCIGERQNGDQGEQGIPLQS